MFINEVNRIFIFLENSKRKVNQHEKRKDNHSIQFLMLLFGIIMQKRKKQMMNIEMNGRTRNAKVNYCTETRFSI